MKDLQAVIIGMGWVSDAHIAAFQHVAGVKVAGICSRRRFSADALQKQYGQPLKAFPDYHAVLADPSVDIVSICTENAAHAEQVLQAIAAGKHVYVEKPIALCFADARKIRDAAAASRVKVCVGFECRFSMQLQMMRSVIDKGLLGRLYFGEADYYHGIGPWYGQFRWSAAKAGGGSALLSGGCHALDALLFAMDEPVEEVSSYSTKNPNACYAPYEFNPCSVSLLKFAGGKLGKVTAAIDALMPYYFHIHLLGSQGSLLDNKLYSEALKGGTKERWSVMGTSLLDSGEVLDHPYFPQMQAFADCIVNNKPMPLTGIEAAYETHRVVYACDLSAQLGRPVRLSELA